MTAEGRAGALRIRALTKLFGDVRAVDGIALEVRPGEFVTLLGPSGSGKTTTLRMIAGFIEPESGTIEVDGRELTGVPPYKRDVGMIFQNYALFPHMTAEQNIAFPLEMRGVRRAEARRRVDQALEMVRLGGLGRRYPRQLSGGQQQRIAFARAVVFNPRLLLMDEPLGALDKKLREALQLEIIRISRQLGITVLYVTHDQEEALVLSDRIAIFNHGRIEQLGSGEDLYERPASLFVADFIGESNIFRGRLAADEGGQWVVSGANRWRVSAEAVARTGLVSGSAAAVVVRPERLRILDGGGPGDADNSVDATVSQLIYLGSARKYQMRLADGTPVIVREQAGSGTPELAAGRPVRLGWSVAEGVVVADEAPEQLARDEAGDVVRGGVTEGLPGEATERVAPISHRE